MQHQYEHNGVHRDESDHLNEVDDKIKVYNFSSSDENQVTYEMQYNNWQFSLHDCAIMWLFHRWGDVKRITTSFGHKNPIKRNLWIITYNTTPYRWFAKFLTLFYHLFPALIFDLILRFRKKQPRWGNAKKMSTWVFIILLFPASTDSWSCTVKLPNSRTLSSFSRTTNGILMTIM